MYAFTVLVLLHLFIFLSLKKICFVVVVGGGEGGGVLAFYHVDTDVCIYSTCAIFDCQLDSLMLIMYSPANSYVFTGYSAI